MTTVHAIYKPPDENLKNEEWKNVCSFDNNETIM